MELPLVLLAMQLVKLEQQGQGLEIAGRVLVPREPESPAPLF
jgi:hypothetical protein